MIVEPGLSRLRETFSLEGYCPHSSNHSPVRTIVISLSVGQIEILLFGGALIRNILLLESVLHSGSSLTDYNQQHPQLHVLLLLDPGSSPFLHNRHREKQN